MPKQAPADFVHHDEVDETRFRVLAIWQDMGRVKDAGTKTCYLMSWSYDDTFSLHHGVGRVNRSTCKCSRPARRERTI